MRVSKGNHTAGGRNGLHLIYNSGSTATGTKPVEGRTIAVDPDIIPLGSVVYIEGYGVRIAEDTGAYTKGDRMDLYVEDWDVAKEFGRKKKIELDSALSKARYNLDKLKIERSLAMHGFFNARNSGL